MSTSNLHPACRDSKGDASRRPRERTAQGFHINQRNCLVAAWLILFLSTLVRLFLAPHYLLAPDEANYWQWSRHLALGYHDHPPMIAWTIWLASQLFGQSEFAVRLPTILGLTVTGVYVFLLAGRLFSCRCGFHAILLMQGILLFNGSALIATPDGLLLPCWAAASYHAARAWECRETNWLHWLLCGLWFGIGLLSKYTMLLFLPSLLFFLLSNSQGRRALASPWPWLGLLAGFACFTPVLLWNADNGWATFRHVLYQGGLENRSFFTLRFIGDFLGSQALLLSPLVFIMICRAWLGSGKTILPNPLDVRFLRYVRNHILRVPASLPACAHLWQLASASLSDRTCPDRRPVQPGAQHRPFPGNPVLERVCPACLPDHRAAAGASGVSGSTAPCTS